MEIPGYKIHSVHGKGGMATVFLATQESLDREVALKVMAPQAVSDEMMCERFLKEGKIIARLEHPNIVTIFDIEHYESYYYMSMEFCAVQNLKERIESPEGVKNPLQVLRQIGGALACAHGQGFIHRDVKPGNILFRDEDTPVLTDFGIAKSMQAETQLTAIGWTLGTPTYMGPEQATGKEVDARADLYSLGVVFYEMLTGNRPYVGADAFATALMHVNEPIPRLPEKHAEYQALLDKLMAKDPADRFQSGEELIAHIGLQETAIADATRIMPELIRRDATTEVLSSPKKNGKLLWLGLAGLVIVAAVAVTVLLMPASPTLSPPSRPDESTTLDDSSQVKVDRLLDIAGVHAAIGRLREPPGSNAYEAYKMVLELDPNNQQALDAMAEIEASEQ